MIKTKRLVLRCFRDDDLHDLVTMVDRWEIAQWLSNLPFPYNEDHGRGWIALVKQNHGSGRPTRFAIAAKDTGRLIGACGLDADSGVDSEGLEIGYWIGPQFQGRGFGREAIAALVDYGLRVFRLPSVQAVVHPENIASKNLLLACGFRSAGFVLLKKPMRKGGTTASLFRKRAVAIN